MKSSQIKVTEKCIDSRPLNFANSSLDSKNSSISVGGGYSQAGGWNGNITYTKKW